jgi:exopolyphosphatase/guanosine-5'-triphosphate,3'-diphosphate pyrophosphatase
VRVAAVDIGTNTVRLLVAEVVVETDGLRIRFADRHEVITRLGEGLDASGRLGAEPIGRALAGLAQYAGLIEEAGVDRVAGVATAATRSAENGSEFIDQATKVLGFPPRVIDGVEEARLTFIGATNALRQAGSFCVLDVGGGSTEFVIGATLPDYALSIDVGSVRLTERIAAAGTPDATAMREYVDKLFQGVVPPYQPSLILGSGGTFVTLGAVCRELGDGEPGGFEPMSLTFGQLQATTDRLLTMTVGQIAQLEAVAPARAGVLQAGAICAERAVAQMGSSLVQISVSDILDGVALQLADE